MFILNSFRSASNTLPLLFVLIGSSCAKLPTGTFTTDKSEYTAGDTMKLTSTSMDAKNYKWTLPFGENSTEKNPYCIIPETTVEGEYNIALETSSKHEKKKASSSASVKINYATGQMIIWTSNPAADSITVFIGKLYTIILPFQAYNSPPPLDQLGYLRATCRVGSYNINAQCKNLSWSGTVYVSRGKVAYFELK